MLRIDRGAIAEVTSAGNDMDRVEDECVVTCTDNGNKATAQVLDFKPQQKLTVVLNKAIKMTMNWSGREYVANMQGLEFTTAGPKVTKSWDGKR